MLVGIALGLALGGVGGWLLGRVGEAGARPRIDAAAARARADEIAKRVTQLDAAVEARERDLRDTRQQSNALTERLVRATAELDHRRRSIENLVKPLQVTVGQVDAKLQQVEKERAGSEARLNEQLQTLATSTSNLERALQTPHVRGSWGEVQLRRVVELAGMLHHCDFSEKTTA